MVCENWGQGQRGRMQRGKAAKTRPSNAMIVKKPAKMRLLNAASKRKLQKCYPMRERGSGTGCVNAVRKSCQNATVECGDCAKPAKMRPLKAESERKLQKCDQMGERGAGAGWENAARKSCQNATVERRDCAKPAKMRPLNAEGERKLQKCDRMQERGAGTEWENAKTRPSNAAIVQNLPKRDRRMQRLCKTC